VGHGNAAVLRAPTGEVVVVDGGRGTDGPARWNPLIRYLRHEGVGRVDAVINTHPDSDHVGGLVNLLSVIKVGAAYQPVGAFGRSRTAWKFGDLLAERKIPLQHLRRGDAFQLPGGIQVWVLHPPALFKTRKHGDNNLSLVLQLSYPGSNGRFLLTLPGDLEREGLESLRKVNLMKGGWLVAPHHGRNAQDNAVAASLFEPSIVVLSDSSDHPDTEQAIRFSSPSANFLPLNRTGCVEVEIDTQGRTNMTTFLEK
jgi:competence protein ComEC